MILFLAENMKFHYIYSASCINERVHNTTLEQMPSIVTVFAFSRSLIAHSKTAPIPSPSAQDRGRSSIGRYAPRNNKA